MKRLIEITKTKWFRALLSLAIILLLTWLSGRMESSDNQDDVKPTDVVMDNETTPTEGVKPTDTPNPTETPKPTDTPKPTKAPTDAPTPTEKPVVQYTFRTKSQLDSHFEKHGHEMNASSAEEYLEMANRVIQSEDALHKLEKEDNDHIYYLVETNEFVVLSQDGYIRTYFLPSAGLDYYERQ